MNHTSIFYIIELIMRLLFFRQLYGIFALELKNLFMDKIIISCGLSFIITFFAIPIIIQITKEKKLFDEPDQRKIHKIVIPTLGGLGIYAGFVIATLMFVPFTSSSCFQHYIAASLVIFFSDLKMTFWFYHLQKNLWGS